MLWRCIFSDLDVELGAPPVATLGVVLSKGIAEHVRGFKGTLIAGADAPGSWCPTSDGTTGGWGYRKRLRTSAPPPFSRCHSPVLARRLGENALRAESLLGRLITQRCKISIESSQNVA